MKVLLIWEEIPERTRLYSLTGQAASLAIAAAGYFINAEENDAVNDLNVILREIEPLGNDSVHEAFDITGHDKVVIAGFIA